ncbi:MAG: TetR/AcrR family transcriptional regulator [Bifidobacteriaceae bacterium]|jgi:AcrR family transcriptional regulator|nr:TetR/AcrR family transcriptional regulator [Bifidobacteriaceae bacterium]
MPAEAQVSGYVPPKVANHRAIIEAAVRLSEERGLGHFTADELAEAAGVSRRTIFNHFASVDHAAYEGVFAEVENMLQHWIAAMASLSPDTTALPPAFQAMSQAILAEDLAPAFKRITQLLAAGSDVDMSFVFWEQGVLQRLGTAMTETIMAAAPRLPRLEVEVMVASTLSAVAVVFTEWLQTPKPSRPALRRLLTRAVEQVGRGYL